MCRAAGAGTLRPMPIVYPPILAALDYPLLTTIAAGFAGAWLLGLLTHRLGLSPIVGYLLAGVLIGPHTPGFIGDVDAAQQLAEVGVILLMFGVGLHFDLKDLWAVRRLALPGAVGQSLAATLVALGLFHLLGLPAAASIVIGLAMAVASTVVLTRVLMDADALNTPPGHTAMGWLIVEDLFTVIILVLVPVASGLFIEAPQAVQAADSLASATHAAAPSARSLTDVFLALGLALLKLGVLAVLILVVGGRVVPWILVQVARVRSRELFTLTVLVVSVTIAVGSAVFFGASVALGAFLAGMVVAHSPVSQQAAADALPLRDAFAVIFFVAVGMLFDPAFLVQHPLLVLAGLVVVMIVKPLAALVIVLTLGGTVRTALTVALGLAQIGEFSFILASVAQQAGGPALMPAEGFSLLVATAIISIALNPLLFRLAAPTEAWLRARPKLWRRLNTQANRRLRAVALAGEHPVASPLSSSDDRMAIPADATSNVAPPRRALVVGYGPVGRSVDALLRTSGIRTVVLETNLDAVQEITREGREAIFGDAGNEEILTQAGITSSDFLVVTLPHSANRGPLITLARQLHPEIRILVRTRYLRERADLLQVGGGGPIAAISEEAEAAVALSRLVLADLGTAPETIDRETQRLRREFSAE